MGVNTSKLKMSTAINVSNSMKELSCSICQDTFHLMTVSSCLHTFCQKCLDGGGHFHSSWGKDQCVCPICNISIHLSGDRAKTYKSRYGVNGKGTLDEMYSDAKDWNDYCDNCRSGLLAVSRCLHCNGRFCGNCTLIHMKNKTSRCHKVVPLYGYDTKERALDESLKYCPRHRSEEILVVCKECNLLLCLICKHMEHEYHVTSLISEEAENMRRKLSGALELTAGLLEFNSVVKKARILSDTHSPVHLLNDGPRIYEKLNAMVQRHVVRKPVKLADTIVSNEINDSKLDDMTGYVKHRDDRKHGGHTAQNRRDPLPMPKTVERPDLILKRIRAGKVATFQFPFKDGNGVYLYHCPY